MSAPRSRPTGLRDIGIVIAAFVWLLAFGAHFFVQRIGNDPGFPRTEILSQTHWLLLDNILPAGGAQSRNSGWHNFPQRFDLLFVAAVMLLATWCAGQLGMRCLRIATAWQVETTVFAFGLGFSAWTIVTLGLGLAGLLSRWVIVALMLATVCVETASRIRKRSSLRKLEPGATGTLLNRRFLRGPRLPIAVGLAVAPFLVAMLLGAMLPTTDFDVKEYHLQGPKEWYQQGRISFLPHNAYTSFPFLTEMVSLWGMVLRGDWYRGALVGQAVLMAFAPLSALAIYAIAGRVSTAAGWLAVGAFLTIPWVYRISVIAYAEGGLTFFLAATFLAWLQFRDACSTGSWRRSVLLCGLLAGSALACKYPGLVSVTVPIGLAVVVTASFKQRVPPLDRPTSAVGFKRGTATAGEAVPGHDSSTLPPGRSRSTASGSPKKHTRPMLTAAALFSLGAAITFGPWALKNLIQTGNPVYPLAYTVFGGVDWTSELNEKWRHAHGAPIHLLSHPTQIPGDLWQHIQEVTVLSVWQSPLVFGLAPLALLAVCRRRPREDAIPAEPRALVMRLTLYSAWLFFTWWGMTHRIDRFWIPMLPIVCALAGIGTADLIERFLHLGDAGRRGAATLGALGLTGLLALATAYNLALVTTSISGNNEYLLDETLARRVAMQQTPSIALLSERLPDAARVLLVGEAAVFDASFELRYNTVFDFELLQAWATDDPLSLYDPDIPLKSREEILTALREHGITHVFVNWLEIVRYREPGSYTYTDFISPRTLQKLVALGVLEPVRLSAQEQLVIFDELSDNKQQVIQNWAPELRTQEAGTQAATAYELFTVAE